MPESRFQAHVMSRLNIEFPGCFILKNDSSYLPGVPDLLILWQEHWAMLEVKANRSSRFRPNQEYYLALLDDMSFAACIYPEIENEVFYALQQAFGLRRPTRVAKRKQA